MAQVESANHEEPAFARLLSASSREAPLGHSVGASLSAHGSADHELTEASAPVHRAGAADALVIAWAIGLVMYTLLQSTLLVDTAAFVRAAVWFDRPTVAWVLAGCGYAGILAASSQLRATSASQADATRRSALSILALLALSYDVFLLRWPWLVGSADATSRLSVWAGALSSTWQGVPAVAFIEVLGIAMLLTQSFLGLRELVRQRWGALILSRVLGLGLGVAILMQLLACTVIVLLATGRR
jgi:hypothetical protein